MPAFTTFDKYYCAACALGVLILAACALRAAFI